MNNVKYYNDSLAYDFNMFMPRETSAAPKRYDQPKKKAEIVKIPKSDSKSRVKAARRTVNLSVFAVLFSVLMLAAFCGNIYLRLRINEVNSDINDIKSEIEVLDSERTSLEVEFERRISYSNIEVEAAEIGMKKLDKNQVKYITVNENNTAVTEDGKTLCSTKTEQ